MTDFENTAYIIIFASLYHRHHPDFLSLNPYLYSHLPYISPIINVTPPRFFLFSLGEGRIVYGIAKYISDFLVLFLEGIAGFSRQEGKRSIPVRYPTCYGTICWYITTCRLFLLMLQNSRPCLQLYRSHCVLDMCIHILIASSIKKPNDVTMTNKVAAQLVWALVQQRKFGIFLSM